MLDGEESTEKAQLLLKALALAWNALLPCPAVGKNHLTQLRCRGKWET